MGRFLFFSLASASRPGTAAGPFVFHSQSGLSTSSFVAPPDQTIVFFSHELEEIAGARGVLPSGRRGIRGLQKIIAVPVLSGQQFEINSASASQRPIRR